MLFQNFYFAFLKECKIFTLRELMFYVKVTDSQFLSFVRDRIIYFFTHWIGHGDLITIFSWIPDDVNHDQIYVVFRYVVIAILWTDFIVQMEHVIGDWTNSVEDWHHECNTMYLVILRDVILKVFIHYWMQMKEDQVHDRIYFNWMVLMFVQEVSTVAFSWVIKVFIT